MKQLFDSVSLGKLTAKNRFFRGAVGDRIKDGKMGEENYSLYKALAEGGVGSILTGFTMADESEKDIINIFRIGSDAYLDDHKKLTDIVHKAGALIFSQIVFVGSNDNINFMKTYLGDPKKLRFLGASSMKDEESGIEIHEASQDEIKRIVEKHAEAAVRVKKAGYDGLEIHGAHGFFLSQFMSPRLNKRTDAYGGDPERRGALALEIYREVRKAVGADFPILIKVNVKEDYEDGVVLEEVIGLGKRLSEEKIDGIEISGNWGSYGEKDGAFFLKEGARMAEESGAKIILTGGLREKEQMTKILNETKIEFLGIARPLMKDPAFVRKLAP
jgi:2,4-dienoyl-CoA reductase-like NADH-dependent reductase (Old Yellow Enzyme family)